MSKKITRDDVAKLAGVSPAVVSYVINQTKFVSEEKTQAVRRAIEELQYRPNLHARSLKTNKSMQIAFVCDNLRNNWLRLRSRNSLTGAILYPTVTAVMETNLFRR